MILMPYAIVVMPDGDNKRYMERMYEQYVGLMYNIAWQYSKDSAIVDDIVSDAVVALVQNINTLIPLEHKALSKYIVKTVRSAALNLFDKQQRINGHVVHMDVEAIQSIEDKVDIEKKFVIDEELDRVMAAINRLPEKEQIVMRMKFQMELPDEVIAAAVGLSANSIPKYVGRARKKLKKMLY